MKLVTVTGGRFGNGGQSQVLAGGDFYMAGLFLFLGALQQGLRVQGGFAGWLDGTAAQQQTQ